MPSHPQQVASTPFGPTASHSLVFSGVRIQHDSTGWRVYRLWTLWCFILALWKLQNSTNAKSPRAAEALLDVVTGKLKAAEQSLKAEDEVQLLACFGVFESHRINYWSFICFMKFWMCCFAFVAVLGIDLSIVAYCGTFFPRSQQGFVNVLCFHTTPLLGILSPINSCENWMFGSTFPSVVHQSIKQHIQYFNWLVVWNMYFIFPFSWEFHHPNWRIHIFQRVGIPPTSPVVDRLGIAETVSPWWTGNLPYV